MKAKTQLSILLPFCIIFSFSSCKKEAEPIAYVDLERESVTIAIEGGEETVGLKSNGQWEIQDIPEWLTISPMLGEYNSQINISVTKNEDKERRTASLLFICGEQSSTLSVTQLSIMDLDPFIELGDFSQMAQPGSSNKIQLTGNCEWTIEGIPDWLTVNPKSGNGTEEITITALENRDPEARAVSLTFIGKEVQNTLDVVQGGLKEVYRVPLLPIFRFGVTNCWISSGLIECCRTTTKSMFVNPAIKDEIYLGNLLCHDAQPHTNIPVFSGYTFNPITVVGNDVSEETFLPSLAAQKELAKQVIEESNPSGPLKADFGTVEFYDHRQLHAVGMVNMGIKLDEIVSGASFPEKEMTRKFGVIFSFKRILFSLKTDTPQNLIQEELKEADITKGVSYVSSVSYGKVGLLVVESDIDSRIVRRAIERVLRNRPVSEQEQNAINSADICYVYYNTDNEVQVNKGGMEAVNSYKRAMKTKDNVYPVQFQLSNFTSHETSSISFSYEMPE